MEVIIFTCLLLASASARHLDELSYPGTPVNITAVPFMAMIRLKTDRQGCGATIVHKRFLVTATHCAGLNPSNSSSYFQVTVGTDVVGSGEDVEIANVFIHPKLNFLDYELAVIQLKKDLKFSDRVNLIEIADMSTVPKPGELVNFYGFEMHTNQQLPDRLLEFKIPFVDLPTCKKRIKPAGYPITERMVCAGEKGKQACPGVDDGSPLVYKGQLIGTLSLDIGCSYHELPNIYAYVPSMLDFIRNVIKNNL